MVKTRLIAMPILALLPFLVPAPVDAASFVLNDGEVIEGSLLAATRNTLTVLSELGGMRQIPANRVEQVRVRGRGGVIAGTVEDVTGQRILVRTAEGRGVWIEGDRVVADAPPRKEPTVQVTRIPPAPGASEPTVQAAPSAEPDDQQAAATGPSEPTAQAARSAEPDGQQQAAATGASEPTAQAAPSAETDDQQQAAATGASEPTAQAAPSTETDDQQQAAATGASEPTTRADRPAEPDDQQKAAATGASEPTAQADRPAEPDDQQQAAATGASEPTARPYRPTEPADERQAVARQAPKVTLQPGQTLGSSGVSPSVTARAERPEASAAPDQATSQPERTTRAAATPSTEVTASQSTDATTEDAAVADRRPVGQAGPSTADDDDEQASTTARAEQPEAGEDDADEAATAQPKQTTVAAAAPSDEAGGQAADATAEPSAEGTTPADATDDDDRLERDVAAGRSFVGLVPPAAAAPTNDEPGEGDDAGPPLVNVKVLTPEVDEVSGKVGFRIELSRASDQPIKLIFATVDGEAAAGQDYEATKGVVTLPPGETGRSIETKVLDDTDAEGAEQFFLFVTTDGEQATVANKWSTVTIKDND